MSNTPSNNGFTKFMINLASAVIMTGGALIFWKLVAIGSDVAVIKSSLTDLQSNMTTLQASQRDLEHRVTIIEARGVMVK